MSQETTALLIKDLSQRPAPAGSRLEQADCRRPTAWRAGAAVEAVDDLAAVIGEKKNADLCLACVQAFGADRRPASCTSAGASARRSRSGDLAHPGDRSPSSKSAMRQQLQVLNCRMDAARSGATASHHPGIDPTRT